MKGTTSGKEGSTYTITLGRTLSSQPAPCTFYSTHPHFTAEWHGIRSGIEGRGRVLQAENTLCRKYMTISVSAIVKRWGGGCGGAIKLGVLWCSHRNYTRTRHLYQHKYISDLSLGLRRYRGLSCDVCDRISAARTAEDEGSRIL